PGRSEAPLVLLDDLGDHARADRAPTLSDGEAQALVHGDRLDQLDLHLDVVAGHDHLDALGQLRHAGDIGRAEIELRPVAREERSVTTTLLLLEDIDLSFELGVGRDRAGLAEHLAALDLLTLGASKQTTHVVSRLTLVEDLAEHLHTGDHSGGGVVDSHDLDRIAGVDDALLNATRRNGAASGDREDILDGHQERLVELAHRLGDVAVERRGKLNDLALVLLVALERLQSGACDEWNVIARKVVLGEQLAHLHLDQFHQLLVIDHVGLVEEHDDVRHTHLAGKQDV